MPHPRRLLSCALLAWLSVCAACASQTSSTTTATRTPTPTLAACPTPTGDPLNEVRFWARNQIAVSVVLTQGAVSQDSILSVINRVIAKNAFRTVLTPVKDNSGLPSLIRVGQTATAFFTIANAEAQCDTNVRAIVTAINATLTKGSDSANRDGLLTFPGGWVAGASPNWYSNSAYDGGGDGVHGSPGGLPTPTIAKLLAGQSAPLANPSSVTYVLDTGYPLNGNAQLPATCGSDAHPCMPLAQPLDPKAFGATADTYAASSLPSVLTESDLALGDERTFEDFNQGHEFNVQDHGLFISELIHHLAPTTQIVLLRSLNNYGVGDLRTLLFALQSITTDPGQFGAPAPGRVPTVINLSLNFGPSISCFINQWHGWIDQSDSSLGKIAGQHTYDQTACSKQDGTAASILADAPLYSTIGETLASLTNGQQHVTVVAAAGNDNGDYAHLPAGFCGVVAAGAATSAVAPPFDRGQLAPFSDVPFWPNQGCLREPTDVTAPLATYATNGATYAMALGVNLCSLYFQDNLGATTTPGLANWSGTSFAAALVSGNIAANPSIVPSSGGAVPVAKQTMPCA